MAVKKQNKGEWHMRIGANMSAFNAANYLSKSEKKLKTSLERLSSGYKINTSKDSPSGMAISSKMRTQIKNLERASMNASDGISVVQTAEGALAEVESMLQRINELCVQGANDTYTDEDRKNVLSEVEALKKEITRISTDTEFNNIKLLNGDVQRRTYTLTEDASGKTQMVNDASVSYLSNTVPAGEYGLTIAADGSASFATDAAGEKIGFSDTAILTTKDNKVTVTDADGFEMEFTIDTDSITAGDYTFEVWEMGTMPIQVGNREGQTVNICIPEVSSETLNLDTLDFSTSSACSDSIDIVSKAISRVSQIRSELGAYQNRFEYTISSLDATNENLTSALSRIQDVDMAEEMTNYTQYNVLQQAGVSMVTQANQLPEKVLQLLQ